MPLSRSDDLTGLLTPSPAAPLSVTQGFLTAWDGVTFSNTVTVGTVTLSDLPVVSTATPGSLTAGVLVLLLRQRNTYYILGKITYPSA